MFRYLIIESKQEIKTDESPILSVFSEFIDITKVETEPYALNIYYQQETDISFSDVILNMMSDALIDLRIYVSYQFESEDALQHHMKYIKDKLKLIPFIKYVYIDDRILIKSLLNQVDQDLKHYILKRYERDHSMILSIKTYLESNQNMSSAAKKLYIHRNTLIQRLDKFHQVTGFDVRVFNDAFLIYHLVM